MRITVDYEVVCRHCSDIRIPDKFANEIQEYLDENVGTHRIPMWAMSQEFNEYVCNGITFGGDDAELSDMWILDRDY